MPPKTGAGRGRPKASAAQPSQQAGAEEAGPSTSQSPVAKKEKAASKKAEAGASPSTSKVRKSTAGTKGEKRPAAKAPTTSDIQRKTSCASFSIQYSLTEQLHTDLVTVT